MAQNQNQFGQTVVQGKLDITPNPSTVSAQIDVSELGTLVPGQSVKVVDSAGGVPKVIACAADSDDVWAFINYDLKKASFVAGDRVEVSAMRGNVMYMTSSAAIARNAKVMIVVAGVKVATRAGGGICVGRTFDKATAADQLIRVVIDLPGVAS